MIVARLNNVENVTRLFNTAVILPLGDLMLDTDNECYNIFVLLIKIHVPPRTGIELNKTISEQKSQQQRQQPCTRKSEMKLSGQQKQ